MNYPVIPRIIGTMIAPKVSRKFYNALVRLHLWAAFVGVWKAYERFVRPSKHITLDGIDGGPRRPYLTRWHVLPRNKWLNVYLHRFVHGDDDRALHDHPWHSASLILDGRYREHTAEFVSVEYDKMDAQAVEDYVLRCQECFAPSDGRTYTPGSVLKHGSDYEGFYRFDYTQEFETGDFRLLTPTHRHMIELHGDNDEPCLTLFITGRLLRRWGFQCKQGWRDFEEYTAPHPTIPNATRGCD